MDFRRTCRIRTKYVQNSYRVRTFGMPSQYPYKGRIFAYKGRIFAYRNTYFVRILACFWHVCGLSIRALNHCFCNIAPCAKQISAMGQECFILTCRHCLGVQWFCKQAVVSGKRPQFAASALTGFRDFMGECLLTILVPAAWKRRYRGCLAFDWRNSPGHFGCQQLFVFVMLHMGTYGPKSCCRLLTASVTVARACWYDFPFSCDTHRACQCTGVFLHFARWLLQCWTGARLLRKGRNNQ